MCGSLNAPIINATLQAPTCDANGQTLSPKRGSSINCPGSRAPFIEDEANQIGNIMLAVETLPTRQHLLPRQKSREQHRARSFQALHGHWQPAIGKMRVKSTAIPKQEKAAGLDIAYREEALHKARSPASKEFVALLLLLCKILLLLRLGIALRWKACSWRISGLYLLAYTLMPLPA